MELQQNIRQQSPYRTATSNIKVGTNNTKLLFSETKSILATNELSSKQIVKANTSRFLVVNEATSAALVKRNKSIEGTSYIKKLEQKENKHPCQTLKVTSICHTQCQKLGKRCLDCLTLNMKEIILNWSSEEKKDKRMIVQGLNLISQGLDISKLSNQCIFKR